MEQTESALRRAQQMAEDQRKRVIQSEMKLKTLTATTVKDLKNQLKERSAEVEVLKEMVKSSNMQTKTKDIDIQRLTKRLNRIGDRENSSSSGAARQKEQSPPSRNSRQSNKSPKLGSNRPETITETDAIFEQTGRDPYQSNLAPTMTKTRQQEWEEAVELDRMLEKERRDTSLKRMQ